MGTIKFKDEKQFETVAVYGGGMTFQNANRDTLEIRIAEENATFDALKAIYTDADALSKIEICTEERCVDETGAETKKEVKSLQLNYTLPVELGLKQLDGVSTWCMKIAQKSAIEIAQDKQAADINDTQLALIELAGMIGGEANG